MTKININLQDHEVDAPEDMPMLWVLRDVVGLTGTKFGCGIAQCGACTVHLDGQPIRSCVTPVSAVVGRKVTTIEAIGETSAGKAVQRAWLDREVIQCGYCQSGQIMSASALLASKPHYGRGSRSSHGELVSSRVIRRRMAASFAYPLSAAYPLRPIRLPIRRRLSARSEEKHDGTRCENQWHHEEKGLIPKRP